MKAISLWQPWASAIALGLKRVETRSWPTKHRGPIAIHAAKTKKGVRLGASFDVVCAVAHRLGIQETWMGKRRAIEDAVPFGAIVAVAEIVRCELCDPDIIAAEGRARGNAGVIEVAMGDWIPGRWLWRLDKIRAVEPPVPALGRQGVFEVEDSKVAVR